MSLHKNFASIQIDGPQSNASLLKSSGAIESSGKIPEDEAIVPISSSFKWGCLKPYKELDIRELLPLDDEKYRMQTVKDILTILQIDHDGNAKIADETALEMRIRLSAHGMKMACAINGPLRLRLSDKVGIYKIGELEEVPTRSTITLCLYMMLWLAEADGQPSERDFEIIDRWIRNVEPKAKWTPAAEATVRWLASRKLVFTRRRKQRAQRLSKLPIKRQQLINGLLELVSHPLATSSNRMKRLETIYPLIGLNPSDIHSDLHRLSTSEMVIAPTKNATLQSARLKEIEQSTLHAQKLLSEVFTIEEKHERESQNAEENVNDLLDVFEALAKREEWDQKEFQELAKARGMTSGVLLEELNDYAFEKCSFSVAEDEGDSIWIDQEIVQECIKSFN